MAEIDFEAWISKLCHCCQMGVQLNCREQYDVMVAEKIPFNLLGSQSWFQMWFRNLMSAADDFEESFAEIE